MKSFVTASAILSICGLAQAQSFLESFNGTGAGVEPIPTNWTSVNTSPGGPGTNPNWQVRTDGLVFAAQAGAGYAFANFNSSTNANPCDNWLISPIVTFRNGDTIKFWTRTVDRNAGGVLSFPDALQVRLAVGNTTIGATQAALLGTFSVLALDINPSMSNNPAPAAPSGNPPTTVGYPDTWTEYTVTVSGVASPTTGRFAFRYFTQIDGGPLGIYSNYLGVDEVDYFSNSGGGGAVCYPNCDASTTTPFLNVNDFVCFNNAFAAAQAIPIAQQITSYANCDASTTSPILNVNDFVCFNNLFAAGCSAP
ncbi:MAG: choice-of-anchor J domain-containing protein [Phycisphaerae bacterium]|nr:choice-of-anchor J domain-containing protein [Phycisphaerae bacterium]